MWKTLAKEVKCNIFLHKSDTNSIYNPKVIKAGIKSRPTDENGVYKTNKMYQLPMKDIKPILLKWVKDNKKDKLSDVDLPDALGIKDRMVFFRDDRKVRWVIYNNGYSSWMPGTWDSDWLDENWLCFALFGEMEELKKNAKEKACLEAKQLSQRKVKLNTLMFKDNIIAAFKKEGFALVSYDAGKKFRIDNCYNSRTGCYEDMDAYNRFIEKAVDYYINDRIVKELGCKIHVPKPDNKKGVRYHYDDIIDLENIDIEGECDGSENLN